MKQLYKLALITFSLYLLCACHNESPDIHKDKGHSLKLTIVSRNTDNGSTTSVNEEQVIRSIYMYAFDGNYLSSPDYFADAETAGQQSQYNLTMDIRDCGKKRFYLFINPPLYIKEQLVRKCPEERLKSFRLNMTKPLTNIKRMPQTVDGELDSQDNNGGFPMSNTFEAYVGNISENKVYLYPSQNQTNKVINQIPAFRSLGKLIVKAQLKNDAIQIADNKAQALKVTKIKLYNYLSNGNALPTWDLSSGQTHWSDATNVYAWNPNLLMNLEAMVKDEDKAVIDPYVFENATGTEVGSFEHPTTILSCYLCQNSYGIKATESEQEGLEDSQGNRSTRMRIHLSDGRISDIVLPYLRRNDCLTILLSISTNFIHVSFEKWKSEEVNPEWNESIDPTSNIPLQ